MPKEMIDPFDDPEFCAEYEAWLDSIEPSPAELDQMLDDLYLEELERQAEEHELSQLGEPYIRAINGKEDF